MHQSEVLANNPQAASEFYKCGHNPQKLRSWCISCHSKDGQRHWKRAARSNADRKRIYRYRVTPESFQAQIAVQGGLCAVCRKSLRIPSQDHNHACCSTRPTCGKCNRGVICRQCNSLLSYAEDSIAVLQGAITYLQDWQKKGLPCS